MTDLTLLGKQAKKSAYALSLLDTKKKNIILSEIADALEARTSEIIVANQQDLQNATNNGIKEIMQDRLRLSKDRIAAMAHGIRQVAQLADPIGNVDKMWHNDAGILIGKKRIPLGVIGIIFESRPNVTTDAASLCFKSGNAVILRGGKEAIHSNKQLIQVMQDVLKNYPDIQYAIQFVDDPSHETATQLMQLSEYLDVLIPRGGAGLIQRVKQTATVPVIETGTGNNHVYVDKEANQDMALDIILNAKVQRPTVCNAIETLLVHKAIAAEFLPKIEAKLLANQVEIHADTYAGQFMKNALPATSEDWSTEYLDLIIAVKVVSSLDEAIEHINHFTTHHSEAIITENYSDSQRFLNEIDAACVYINASTRFTDGFMFGFGAEIGISTQKIHARGPMGLEELTTIKYVIYGNGQIRD